MTLRPYQRDALVALAAAFQHHRRVCLVLPTAAGKTITFAAYAQAALSRGLPVLVLAHRIELITQAADKLRAAGLSPGIIKAGYPATPGPLQVASVQSLARRELPPAGVVIVDEAHRAKAPTYHRILAAYPNARILGVTATPVPGLDAEFDELVVGATVRQLTAEGWLVPCTGYALVSPDVSQVARRHGDYDEGQLELACNQPKILGDVVATWRRRGEGLRTLAFCCTVAHSQAMAARFCAEGVAAEHLDGTTPPEERAGILARIKAGTTRVVCSVAVWLEGVDIPELGAAILARPTLSLVVALQQIGRVMRPCAEVGKTRALLLDHARVISGTCGLPDADREWSLTARPRRVTGEPLPSVATCAQCLCLHASTDPACPACGAIPAPKPRRIRIGAGREVSLEEAAALGREQARLETVQWLAQAMRRGMWRRAFFERWRRWPRADEIFGAEELRKGRVSA